MKKIILIFSAALFCFVSYGQVEPEIKIITAQISEVKGIIEYRDMKEVEKPTTEKYVIVHNGKDNISLCHVGVKQVLTTGQPYMEVFETEAEARLRYKELSGKEVELIEVDPIIIKK